MKIVVASDSFKGSLTSAQVAEAVRKGIVEVMPECDVCTVSVADGGEGTVEALVDSLGGEFVELEVAGPMMEPVVARYAVLDDRETAVLEMSSASGLFLVQKSIRNPLIATTLGTGHMVCDALGRGCRKFLVGIGGSATNDGGMGMLEALGFRFLDKDGVELRGCGESLARVEKIDVSGVPAEVYESEFIVACDVDTPFCGADGAAQVFAPQKGADAQMVDELDGGMRHFAEVVLAATGVDVSDMPGAGAAGGLGGAFVAFLGARLERGVEMVLDTVGFDGLLDGADLVITGEGRIDSQTFKGKTPYGVAKRAAKFGIPVWAIGGSVQVDDHEVLGFERLASISPKRECPLDFLMRREIASDNVRRTVADMLQKSIFWKKSLKIEID